MATTMKVHVCVDEPFEMQATGERVVVGMSVIDGERAFPMRMMPKHKVPNAETLEAMAEADEIVREHRARFATASELFDDLEKNSDA